MVIIGLMMVNNNLVGGWPEPLWKMVEFVNGVGMTSHIWNGKQKCSKPPTSYNIFIHQFSTIFESLIIHQLFLPPPWTTSKSSAKSTLLNDVWVFPHHYTSNNYTTLNPCSSGRLPITNGSNWLFLWHYTFHRWDYKYKNNWYFGPQLQIKGTIKE